MVLDLVAEAVRDLVLDLLDSLVEKFDHLARIEADHVIVVIAIRELEDRRAPFEIVPGHEAGTLELREHAVYRGKTELLAGVEQRAIDAFGREMTLFALLEDLEHLQPRRRYLQPRPAQILAPFFHLSTYLHQMGYDPRLIMAHRRTSLHRT